MIQRNRDMPPIVILLIGKKRGAGQFDNSCNNQRKSAEQMRDHTENVGWKIAGSGSEVLPTCDLRKNLEMVRSPQK